MTGDAGVGHRTAGGPRRLPSPAVTSRLWRAGAVVAVLAAGAAAGGVSLCPFATLTGLPCPGCGILRATLELCRGHVAESFLLHPLALVAVPVAALGVVQLQRQASPRPSPPRRLHGGPSAFVAIVVVAMVGVWVARFGGALGGPVEVHSIWSATGHPSPFADGLREFVGAALPPVAGVKR